MKVKTILVMLLITMLPAWALPGDLVFEVVDAPKTRLSKDWLFLFDNSHSMRGVFAKARAAFVEATKQPTDELNFNIISFSNEGQQDVRGWRQATVEEFEETDKWLHSKSGIKSYGCKAMEMALQEKKKDLTVILISDGGFSEGFAKMRESLAKGQAWREKEGLPKALLVSIGIENKNYTAGGKPADEVCQKFMRELGDLGEGGYFLVREPQAQVKR